MLNFDCFLYLLLFLILFKGSRSVNKDGPIEQLKFAQSAVEINTEKCSCISVRFKDVCISVAIYPQNPLREPSIPRVINKHPNFFISYVGRRADCLAARRFSMLKESTQKEMTGVDLDAATLALILADDAQERSRTPGRPLAYNALLIGSYATPNGMANGILKVDVGGNAYRCQAACIGTLTPRVELWFRQRGSYINWEMTEASKRSEPDLTNTSESQRNHSSSSLQEDADKGESFPDLSIKLAPSVSSLEQCFNLVWKCLNETVGTSRLRNCSIEIAVAKNQACDGPFMIPHDWLDEAAVGPSTIPEVTGPIQAPVTATMYGANPPATGRDQGNSATLGDEEGNAIMKRSQYDSPLWRWWQKSQIIRNNPFSRTL